MNTSEITIDGIVTVPEGVTPAQFTDEFIAWTESKGYTFGGGIGPYLTEPNEESSPISEGLRVDFDINNPDRVTPGN